MDAAATTGAPARAPRLTDRLLADDLPTLVAEAGTCIDYLTDALAKQGQGAITGDLRRHMDAKRARLIRARDWLAGKVAAETHHRTED